MRTACFVASGSAEYLRVDPVSFAACWAPALMRSQNVSPGVSWVIMAKVYPEFPPPPPELLEVVFSAPPPLHAARAVTSVAAVRTAMLVLALIFIELPSRIDAARLVDESR